MSVNAAGGGNGKGGSGWNSRPLSTLIGRRVISWKKWCKKGVQSDLFFEIQGDQWKDFQAEQHDE